MYGPGGAKGGGLDGGRKNFHFGSYQTERSRIILYGMQEKREAGGRVEEWSGALLAPPPHVVGQLIN